VGIIFWLPWYVVTLNLTEIDKGLEPDPKVSELIILSIKSLLILEINYLETNSDLRLNYFSFSLSSCKLLSLYFINFGKIVKDAK